MSEPPTPGLDRRAWPAGLGWSALTATLAVLAFLPALRDGFLFDDLRQARLIEPAHGFVDWLGSAADPWWPPDRHKNIWRPVTRLAILAERAAAPTQGREPAAWPFHLASLALHAVASLLTLWLARALGLGWIGAGAAAAFLAVHPLRSEAVHQIVGQAEILATIFIAAGLLHYLRAVRSGAPWPRTALSQAALFALALGSKEHALVYPLFVILIEAYARRGGLASPPGERRASARWIATLSGQLLIVALFFVARYRVTGGLLEDPAGVPRYENMMAGMSLIERLPAAGGLFAYFLSKAVLPVGLSPDYSAISLPLEAGWAWPMSWVGLVLALATLLAVAWSYRRRGSFWVLALGALAAYGLTSNLFFTIGVAVAERLWYFPLVAVGLGFGALWERACARLSTQVGARARLLAPLALALSTLLLLSSTWHYAPAWRTALAHAEWTARRFPRSWRAHHNLSRELYMAKDFESGLRHARRAVDLRPDAAGSWDNLGLNAFFIEGGVAEAERAFRRALELDPELHLANGHLANMLMLAGRPDEARVYDERYRRTKALVDPDDRLEKIDLVPAPSARQN